MHLKPDYRRKGERKGEGEKARRGRGKGKGGAWKRHRAVNKLNKFPSCNHLWIKIENKG